MYVCVCVCVVCVCVVCVCCVCVFCVCVCVVCVLCVCVCVVCVCVCVFPPPGGGSHYARPPRTTQPSLTPGSQFFITTVETPWLDGRHVVFGRVVSGYETVKKVEAVGSQSGTPAKKVVVVDSGELPMEEE